MQFPLKTQLVGSLDEFRRPRSLVLAGLLSAAAVVRDRLRTYHELTEPLIEFYRQRGKLVVVEGQDDIADTTALLLKALEA